MSRFTNPTQTVFPVQGFPYTAPGPLNPMYPAGGMSAPGTAAGQLAPGPVGAVVPVTPNAVQTPDTSYWQQQQALVTQAFSSTTWPASLVEPLPTPTFVAIWSTPVFDLRPNLVASPQQSTGTPLSRGSEAEVAIKITRLRDAVASRPYTFYAAEFSDPSSPSGITAPMGLQPVPTLASSQFYAANQNISSQSVFRPPTGVRYWKVLIVIATSRDTAVAESFDISASAY